MSTQIIKKSDVAITKTYDMSKPAEAVQMAVLLKNLVVQQKLYVPIKGKNYAMVEAWQMAGFLTGMEVIVEEPKDLSNDKEVKYSCTAKLFKGDKQIGVGYALCSSKEATKKSFDEYAILSFAQTRAIGKAYRNKIGFIMKLAGFQATPGEEMVKVDESTAEPKGEPIIDYGASDSIKKVRLAKTLAQLETIWRSLPAKDRADDEIEAIKNEVKAKLS